MSDYRSERLIDRLQAGIAATKEEVRKVVDDAHNSPLVQAAKRQTSTLLAQFKWGSRILPYRVRVPLPIEVDQHLVFAAADFARMLAEQMPGDSWPGSSSGLPPVTLGLIAANSAAFALPNGVDLWDVCLSPYCVVERREYERLATAAFVHINATHLLANLTAAVPDALFIERSRGGAALLAEVGSATALSHGLYVGAAWFAKRFLNSRDIYYSAGAVGFSSVAFALKVSTGAARAGQRVGFMGLGVPSEYAWLVSLVLTHLEVPEASFVGHMAGVVAGILRAYVLGPLLASLVPGGSDSSAARPIGRYNFGSGTVSGRPIRRAPRLFSGLRQGLGKAVKQLGLAAAVSAGFWVLKQQQQSAQRRSLR